MLIPHFYLFASALQPAFFRSNTFVKVAEAIEGWHEFVNTFVRSAYAEQQFKFLLIGQ
jgi:hypothetical protein